MKEEGWVERKQKDGGRADGREMEARRDERKGEPTKKDGWSNYCDEVMVMEMID